MNKIDEIDKMEMKHKSPYYDTIKTLAPKYDPRHVEGYLRVAYPTLDHLSASEFAFKVKMSCYCINEAGKKMAETVAKSYGL